MSDETNGAAGMSKAVQLLATVYGPYAFGVASLLIIWYTIVSPQLARQVIDYQRNEDLMENHRAVIKSLENVSDSLEKTAILLDESLKTMKDSK